MIINMKIYWMKMKKKKKLKIIKRKKKRKKLIVTNKRKKKNMWKKTIVFNQLINNMMIDQHRTFYQPRLFKTFNLHLTWTKN